MRKSRKGVVAVVALSYVLASMGCASRRQAASPGLYAPEEKPVVTVTNNHWLDVVVYVLRGAARFRVATISGSSTGTFQLSGEDASGARPVRLMADPIGSNRSYVTDPILVGPGQDIELRVASPINVSTYTIRNR